MSGSLRPAGGVAEAAMYWSVASVSPGSDAEVRPAAGDPWPRRWLPAAAAAGLVLCGGSLLVASLAAGGGRAAGGGGQSAAAVRGAAPRRPAAHRGLEEQWWTEVPGAAPVAPAYAITTTTLSLFRSVGGSATLDWFDELASGSGAGTPLAPRESMNDGNICEDDEEFYSNLCYRKCTILTDGEYPIRTSPWTCCREKPCTFSNQMHNVGVCSGFDVAGAMAGRDACPHTAGACLTNEEMFMGDCYKKCSVLQPGFPIRVGPATCCVEDGIGCAMPGNSVTSLDYQVGGGAGDGDPTTPDDVHKPLPELTEST